MASVGQSLLQLGGALLHLLSLRRVVDELLGQLRRGVLQLLGLGLQVGRVGRRRVRQYLLGLGGVLVDLFYDHLLAKAWGNHHALPLHVYAARTYAELAVHARELPVQASEIAVSMRRGDWLSSYRDITNVGDAIDRMSVYRMRRANPLSGGVEEYLADAEGFSEDFASFLPDALAFAQNWQATRQRVEPPAG